MTNEVHNHAAFLVKHHRVNTATSGSKRVNFAPPLLDVVENAVTLSVSKKGISFRVDAHKRFPVVTSLFQSCNVLFGKHHIGFLAANPATKTTHERRLFRAYLVFMAEFPCD